MSERLLVATDLGLQITYTTDEQEEVVRRVLDTLRSNMAFGGPEYNALRKDLAVANERIEELESNESRSRQWWAVRIERLKELCKEHGVWKQVAAIMANGSASADEPPRDYGQLLSLLDKPFTELEADATLGAAIRALPADKRSFIEIRRNPDNSGLHEWAMTTIYDDGRYSTQVDSTPEEMLADEVAIHGDGK